MKTNTIILVSCLTCTCIHGGFAQGTILFQNTASNPVLYMHTFNPPEYRVVPQDWAWVQLAYAPAGTAYSGWDLIDTEAQWLARNAGWTLGPTASMVADGLFDGGTVTLDGIDPGEKANFVLFAWNRGDSEATSFFQRLHSTGFTAFPAVFSSSTGNADSPVNLGESFGSIVLVPQAAYIPEPSTASLALFGLAATMLCRRKSR